MPDSLEPPDQFPGDPDGFQRLWTPHRTAYITGENRPASGASGQDCPFCRAAAATDDEQALVVARGRVAYVVLNLYPYNPGHLLICPIRHVADFTELTEEEADEITRLTAWAMRALRKVYQPTGVNLGMNQGETGGAGIAAHLHQHVVPRWRGDSNFFPIVAQTKAIPEILSSTRERLANAWDSCAPEQGSI